MPGALREIIASYSTVVDDKPLTALEKKIDRLKDQVRSFGQWAAAASLAAAAAGYTMVQAASKAEENLNVLSVTFGKNTEAVLRWSKESGAAMGRSEYSMQEYAGSFGSFLDPVFKGTGKDITKMSQELAELSVDLASFYNTSDEEAKMRLFSGMSGETEAVRRLGINIADARLSELNKEINGEKVKYKYLDLAAKTELRMIAIRRDTYAKQGDAARTAGSWANSLKRVQEKFKTLQVTLGKKLLPLAKDLLSYVEGSVNSIAAAADMLGRHVGSFKTIALFSASAAVSWAAMKLAIEYGTKRAAMMALPLTAVVLAIDDIVHFLSGKDSVIGTIATAFTGLKAPLAYFERAMARIVEHAASWAKLIFGSMEEKKAVLKYAEQNEGSMTPMADRAERLIDSSRKTSRDAAVAAGSPKDFVANMNPDETPGAKKRALAEYDRKRREYLKLHPEAVDANDYANKRASLRALAAADLAREGKKAVAAQAPVAPGMGALLEAPAASEGGNPLYSPQMQNTYASMRTLLPAPAQSQEAVRVENHWSITLESSGVGARKDAEIIIEEIKKKDRETADGLKMLIHKAAR